MTRIKNIAAILGMAFLSACAAGTIVPLTSQNADILQGTWKGTMQSKGYNDVVYFETDATLKIAEGRPIKGQFALGIGRRWTTEVKIIDDKAVVNYRGKQRAFTLRRTDDGKLRLVSSVPREVGGASVINSVLLEKQ